MPLDTTHWWKTAGPEVGDGVPIGVGFWIATFGLGANGTPWGMADAVNIDLCMKPCGCPKSAGAVNTTWLLGSGFILDGVKPDGTSMKVFFTGKGLPL